MGRQKGREKEATKRRAVKGTRKGITRQREETARRMATAARRKVKKKRKTVKIQTEKTQARKKDEVEVFQVAARVPLQSTLVLRLGHGTGSREVCGGQAAIGRVLRAQLHGQKCETNPLYKLS